MANMMAGVRLEGTAESGYGVRLSGFHCSTIDFAQKISEFEESRKVIEASQAESNGYITFLGQEWVPVEHAIDLEQRRIAVYRREPHRFFLDLGTFLRKTRACFVDQILLSESLGSVTMTLVYRPAPEAGSSV